MRLARSAHWTASAHAVRAVAQPSVVPDLLQYLAAHLWELGLGVLKVDGRGVDGLHREGALAPRELVLLVGGGAAGARRWTAPLGIGPSRCLHPLSLPQVLALKKEEAKRLQLAPLYGGAMPRPPP